jgi:hypothetical protein
MIHFVEEQASTAPKVVSSTTGVNALRLNAALSRTPD